MSGIGGALNIARWSLYSSQLALEVTAHNIANANTEGFSRQSLRIEPNYPLNVGPGQIGTGVKATEVVRAYDEFINEQVNLKKSEYYFWNAENGAMEEIETIFNESDGYGINKLLGDFWNAWGDLSNNSEGVPERESLINKTRSLVQVSKDVDYNLRAYQRNLDSNLRGAVDEINIIIEQVAELNARITSTEIDGSNNANDLRDRRDLLLGDLSEYMDISYYEEESSGQVMVYIMGGTPLVLGTSEYSLSYGNNVSTGFTNLYWNDNSGRQLDITQRIQGGKIAGWVDVRDNKIGSYLGTMNTLMEELVWQVNDLHSEGVGLSSVSSMVGNVEVSGPGDDLDTDFLFSDRLNAGGSFDIVVYDDATGNATRSTITLDPLNTTVGDLINSIDGLANLNAEIDADDHVHIYADAGFSFAITADETAESSHALGILGVNSFFTWDESVGQPMDDLTETFDVNAYVQNNSSIISAAYVDDNNQVSPGGNDVALGIFSLQDDVITDFGGSGVNTTIDSYYSSFVAQVGVDVQQASMNEKFNDTLLGQYTSRKESVVGINMDEEMASLLQFQHLYQASAKLITIVDEMMQALLSVK